jgi:tRNA nucleotidyltransferase (CCA-adding enzyme)
MAALLAHVGVPDPRSDDPPVPDDLRAADATAARGAARAAALMLRLRASNAQMERVSRLVAAGPTPPAAEASAAALRRWLAHTGADLVRDLGRLWVARCRAGSGPDPRAVLERLRHTLREAPPLVVADLALTGRDLIRLGYRPGPRFGEILESLLTWVLEDPARNERERLEARVRSEWGARS